MAANVTGVFTIIDRASGPMRRMEVQARRTDQAIAGVGDTLDDVGTSKQLKAMDDVERKLRDVDRTADQTGGRGGGLDDTNTQLTRIERNSNKAVGGLNLFTGRMKAMLGIIVVALPYIIDLGGALGALVGSLGAAAAGLGALVTGAGAIGGVGLAGIASVLIPTISRVGELKDAFGELTTAQQQYGRSSQEAVDAAKELRTVQRQLRQDGVAVNPAMNTIRSLQGIRESWMKQIQPGQRDLFATVRQGSKSVENLLPDFGAMANRSMAGFRAGTVRFLDRLDSPQFRNFLDVTSRAAERTLPSLAISLANVGETLGAIAVHVTPEVEDMVEGLEDMTRGWRDSSREGEVFGQKIDGLVDQADSWGYFLRASWRWMKQLFGSGADEGQGLVDSMTAKLNEQTRWMEDNPAKMDNFWRTSVDGAKSFARLIGDLAPTIMDVADAMRPISQSIASIVNALSNLNIGNINALTGLLGVMVMGRGLPMLGIPGMGRGRGRGAPGVPGQASPGAGGVSPLALGMGAGAVGVGAGGARGLWGRYVQGGGVRGVPGAVRGGVSGMSAAAGRSVMGGARGPRSALGGILGGGAKAAGRFVAPLALTMALFEGLSYEGGAAGKAGAALNTFDPGDPFGASFIPDPKMQSDEVLPEVESWVQDLVANTKGRRGTEMSISRLKNVGSDPGQILGKSVTDEAKISTSEYVKPFIAGLEQSLVEQARRAGDRGAQQLFRAFSTRQKNQGDNAAADALLGDIRESMDGLPLKAQRTIGQAGLNMLREAKKTNPALKGEYRDLISFIERRLDQGADKINVVNGNIYRNSDRSWKAISRAIKSPMWDAAAETEGAMETIERNVLVQLQRMGYNNSQAKKILGGLQSNDPVAGLDAASGPTGEGQRPSVSDKRKAGAISAGAHGMRIGGQGLADNVMVAPGHVAAPGELIINRHTESRINRMLGGATTLEHEVNGESRPHSAPIAHAKGGRVGSGSYPDAMGALPGLDALAYVLKQKFGLGVSSGLRPGAITSSGNPSDHGWGGAIDVSNGITTPQMDAAWRFLAQTIGGGGKPSPGVYSGGAISQMIYRSMIGGDHFNHIHVALTEQYANNPELVMRMLGGGKGMAGMAGAGAGIAGAMVEQLKLASPKTKVGGIPGLMAQKAMDAITKGAEEKVNKQLGGAGGGALGKGAGVAKGGLDQWLTQALRITGLYTPANFTALRGRAMQESGGDPTVQNNWDSNAAAGTPSKGLLQTIDPTFDAYKMPGMGDIWNPVHNTVAALRYMMDRYGHVVGPSSTGYAMGGRLPAFGGWFGDGGEFTASRPTLIGVGERGEEHVSITPGGAPPRGVRIGQIHIKNYRSGDIKKQIKEEVHAAFRELDNELTGDEEDELG